MQIESRDLASADNHEIDALDTADTQIEEAEQKAFVDELSPSIAQQFNSYREQNKDMKPGERPPSTEIVDLTTTEVQSYARNFELDHRVIKSPKIKIEPMDEPPSSLALADTSHCESDDENYGCDGEYGAASKSQFTNAVDHFEEDNSSDMESEPMDEFDEESEIPDDILRELSEHKDVPESDDEEHDDQEHDDQEHNDEEHDDKEYDGEEPEDDRMEEDEDHEAYVEEEDLEGTAGNGKPGRARIARPKTKGRKKTNEIGLDKLKTDFKDIFRGNQHKTITDLNVAEGHRRDHTLLYIADEAPEPLREKAYEEARAIAAQMKFFKRVKGQTSVKYQKEGHKWLIEGMNTPLYTFQMYGVAMMLGFEKTSKFKGGLLADSMGLGKTIQTLALIVNSRPASKPRSTLIVVPKALRLQWLAAAKEHCGGKTFARTQLWAAIKEYGITKDIHKFDIVIATYHELSVKGTALHSQDWLRVCVDEGTCSPQNKLSTIQNSVQSEG